MSETEEKKEETKAPEEKKSKTLEEKLAEAEAMVTVPSPCPVIPSSVEKILATLDQLDKGEIDEFDAVQQVTGVMKEHRKVKLEALKKLEPTEQEEETETATE